MAQALPKLFTFEEFIVWLPENTGKRYELHDVIIVEMSQPNGKHEKVTGFWAGEITVEYKRLKIKIAILHTQNSISKTTEKIVWLLARCGFNQHIRS